MVPTRSTLQSSPAGLCCYHDRPDDPNQFRGSMRPDKVARPSYTTKPESSKGRKYFAPEADQPSGPQVDPFSARTSPRPRDSGAVPSLGTLCGNRRMGPKVYISRPNGANHSITLLTPYCAQLPFKESYSQANKVL